jgi:isopenicillin N synthase-like dioxygenase
MGCAISRQVSKNNMPAANTDATPFQLPLVDFTSFSSSNDATQEQRTITAQEIDEANRTHGFVCLRNSGISKSKLQAAFDASQELFSQSATQKEKLKPIDPLSNTGYVGYGGEALNRSRRTDLKEAFNVRGNSATNGEFVGTPPSFQRIATELWDELQRLGNIYAICCALALGLDEQYFSKTLKDMDLCTLRMLHYPPCANESVTDELDSKCAIRVGEHTDFGIFTFLFINDIADDSSLGLQIKHPGGDGTGSNWKNVVFDQESLDLIATDDTVALLVNTGALMARWTNDVWTATAHRVIVSPQAAASHRYSIAMFLDPDKDTICSVNDSFVPEGEEPKYEDIKSIDYLLMKLKEARG